MACTTDFVVLACFVKTSQIKQRSSACKEEFKDLLKAVTAANTISPPQDSASPSPMRGSCTEAAATKPRQNKMAFETVSKSSIFIAKVPAWMAIWAICTSLCEHIQSIKCLPPAMASLSVSEMEAVFVRRPRVPSGATMSSNIEPNSREISRNERSE